MRRLGAPSARDVRPFAFCCPIMAGLFRQTVGARAAGYFVIRQMHIAPITRQGVIEVAFEAAMPLLLLALIATPVEQVFQTLLKMLF
jgi:hypothetical protein